MYDLIVVGAGPAGIFSAICAKEARKNLKILILEKSKKILYKVKVSGGGRCNVTNACFDIKKLCENYPRGKKELISAFNQFQPSDMIKWLKSKGLELKIEEGGRVFPVSDSSQTVIDCFLKEIDRLGIDIQIDQNITDIISVKEGFKVILKDSKSLLCNKLILATGSSSEVLDYAKKLGHSIKKTIPSLFPFKIKKSDILSLSGTSVDNVEVKIPNTTYKQSGDILITHEGFSGPSIINLSSFAAKYLYENNYKADLMINWLKDISLKEIENTLIDLKEKNPFKHLENIKVFNFTNKLWKYFLSFKKELLKPLKDVSKKALFQLAEKLHHDVYQIIDKSQNKQEFVYCGGVDLKEVDFKDMQSKICKNLYFAGEVIDIDGITGGFNFQNAWTTGYVSGNNI